MALTKKFLQAMSLEDAQIEQIIEAHRDTINGLTETRDTLQADLDKANEEVKRLSTVEKDLIKANAKIEEASDVAEELKKLKTEFSEYKATVEEKATQTAKENAYKKLLQDAGVSERRIDSILKITPLDDVEIDADGNIKGSDKVLEEIKTEWQDFIVTETEQGAKVVTPPENNGGSTFEKMSLADKMTYANEHPDSAEVQAWLK